MIGRWANDLNVTSAMEFETLHSGLTVRMIETPRGSLRMCRSDDTVSTVIRSNVERYDYIPVLASRRRNVDAVVGMLHAAKLMGGAQCDEAVAQHMLPLSEEYLIGAEASIRDFIVEADIKPCRIVVAGSGFSGLVTLSDIHRLPVRAALFALVTGFEMTMAEAIKRRFPKEEDWLAKLSEGRRELVREAVDRSKKADGFVDTLLFTQFCDKGDVIRKSFQLPHEPGELKRQFKELQDLRDNLAHANEYATSPDDAKQVCAVVKTLLALREQIARAG